jgi:YidC/Oxa1 family membrane protein insertase
LYAFWSVLSVSIELRQAPWMLWIKDLSRSDPYFIMPILFAVSMIIMQKMMPTTMDPAQAKIMMVMPVMFAFMFLWAQSGLLLYWLTSNVASIGQQVFINKYWPPDAGRSTTPKRKKEVPNG